MASVLQKANKQGENDHLKHFYVPAFDGIRGTVLTVMFVHLEIFIPIFAGHRLTNFLLMDHTWYTLNIFFCLSGFLITWLLVTEMQKTGDVNLWRFYKRRAIRLIPAFITAICLSAIVALWWGYTPGAIFSDMTYFLTYSYNIFLSFSAGTAPILGLFLVPAWSLCVEEQFYVTWSMALKRLTLRRALPAVIGALVALRIYRCAFLFGMLAGGQSFEQITRHFSFGTETRMDVILVGCAAALALQKPRYYELARKYLKTRALPYLLPVGIVLVVFLTANQGIASPAFQAYGAEVSLVMLVAWFVSIMFQPESLVTRALASRPLIFIGRISYGLYIFHYIAIKIVMRALQIDTPSFSLYRALMAWLIVTAGSILFATVHYYLIEKPLLKGSKSSLSLPGRPEPANTAAREMPQRKPSYEPQHETALV
jgi:peptidoglycan/LPS O-acetylase OafA/YrhL